jgi:hypothetical protein
MNSASPSRDSGQKTSEPDGLEQECFTRRQMGGVWLYGLVTGVVVGIGGTLIGQSLLRERVSDPPDTTAANAPATQDKKSTAPEPNDDRKDKPKPSPSSRKERIAEDNRGGVER